MGAGLVLEGDEVFAKWAFETFKMPKMTYDKALGIVENGKVVGAIVFQSWNGFNVELSYYGLKPTLSAGIVKTLARYILFTFNCSRITVSIRRKNKGLMRSLQRFGFKLEGAQHCFYGHRDCNRNTAIRFVMFRDRLEHLAVMPRKKEQNAC